MKSMVLRSKARMSVSKLPLSFFFFFVGIWLHRPCNYDNYFCFSSMHMVFINDKF